MSVTLQQIVNSDTFGVWKDRTNSIITALDDVATLGGTSVDNKSASLWINGDITSTANVVTDVINPYDTSLGNNLITLNGETRFEGDAYLDGEVTIGNDGTGNTTLTFADSNEADSWIITTDHVNTIIISNAGGTKYLEINENTDVITAQGLKLDASIMPTTAATFSGGVTATLTGNVANTAGSVVLNADAGTFTGTASFAGYVNSLQDENGANQFDADDINDGTTNRFYSDSLVQTYLGGDATNGLTLDSNGNFSLAQDITSDANIQFSSVRIDSVSRGLEFSAGNPSGNVTGRLQHGIDSNISGDPEVYSLIFTSDSVFGSEAQRWTAGVGTKMTGLVEIYDQSSGGTSAGLDVYGPIKSDSDITAFHNFSDINLKENIETIDSALEKVDLINGYTFNYKTKPDTRISGVIAQEVQAVLPETVYEVDEHLAVRYDGLVPLLIEAIKELKAEVDELKNKKCTCGSC